MPHQQNLWSVFLSPKSALDPPVLADVEGDPGDVNRTRVRDESMFSRIHVRATPKRPTTGDPPGSFAAGTDQHLETDSRSGPTGHPKPMILLVLSETWPCEAEHD